MPFKFKLFFKPLLWLFPYREATLHLPLPPEAVRQRFAASVPTGLIGETPTLLGRVPYRYKIELDGYFLRATGPYGNRRWCLVTQGKIQDIPGGSVLRLTMRLSTLHSLIAFLVLGWYVGGSIFVIQMPLEMLPIILMQVLFLYAVIVCVFHYEADRTLEVLKQIASP